MVLRTGLVQLKFQGSSKRTGLSHQRKRRGREGPKERQQENLSLDKQEQKGYENRMTSMPKGVVSMCMCACTCVCDPSVCVACVFGDDSLFLLQPCRQWGNSAGARTAPGLPSGCGHFALLFFPPPTVWGAAHPWRHS